MADGMNRVFLFGNLGADPELRTTQSGTAVLKLRMATTERYLDANKTWQDRTEWHSVVVWGKRGEALHRFLTKGSKIAIEGGLRTSSYEDKEGTKRYKTEIHATNVCLAGGGDRDRGARSDEAPAPRQQQTRAPAAPPDDFTPDGDSFGYGGPDGTEDVPF